MARTLLQEKLELQHGKRIEEILEAAFEARRGQKGVSYLVAADLGISDGTVYWWCREFGIDVNEYRRPTMGAEKAAQEARDRVLAEAEGE